MAKMHPDELDRRLRALHDELDATPNDLEALDRLEGRIRLGDFDGVVPQNLLNELARRRVAIKRAQRKAWAMDNRQQAQDKLDELRRDYHVMHMLLPSAQGRLLLDDQRRYEAMLSKVEDEISELTAYLADADKGVPDWLNNNLSMDKRLESADEMAQRLSDEWDEMAKADGDVPGEPIKGAPEAALVEMHKKSKRGLRGTERVVASLSPKQQQLLDILKAGGFVLCERIGVTQRSDVRVINNLGNEVKFPLASITVAALYRRDLIKDVAKFGDYLSKKKFVYRDRDQELQETLDRIKSKR